jgi:FixJ family two-component response regulator
MASPRRVYTCRFIFMSALADVPMSVRAMKAGGVEFLTNPVQHQELLEAIHWAIERFRTRRAEEQAVQLIGPILTS